MLKKAGIVVAAAAAGLLAVSPLAFADTEQHGLVNVNDTTVQVPIQACGNHIGIVDGAFGILGSAKNKQVNSGDCSQDNSSEND
ncbi:hypothetical protein [Pseudonocardia acaciae]|uniref:hypothetical protein n=1 Tax=Pseudonocardia acaciae TaxID=551276 RepID=UPI00055EA03A|nr:hypothetical protein [Pseudonocardia acaciae]